MFKEGIMGRKRYQAVQIISKLRGAEILLSRAGFGTLSPYYSLIKNVPIFSTTHNYLMEKDVSRLNELKPAKCKLMVLTFPPKSGPEFMLGFGSHKKGQF